MQKTMDYNMTNQQLTTIQQRFEGDSAATNPGKALSVNKKKQDLSTFLIIDSKEPTRLPPGYHPRDIDVLCGRGRGFWEHPGNQKLKAIMHANVEKYETSKTKAEKSKVVALVVTTLRDNCSYFVKFNSKENCWYDIGNRQAREKAGHAIRDHLTNITKCKKIKNLTQKKIKTVSMLQKNRNKVKSDLRQKELCLQKKLHLESQQQPPSTRAPKEQEVRDCEIQQRAGISPKAIDINKRRSLCTATELFLIRELGYNRYLSRPTTQRDVRNIVFNDICVQPKSLPASTSFIRDPTACTTDTSAINNLLSETGMGVAAAAADRSRISYITRVGSQVFPINSGCSHRNGNCMHI